MLVGKTLAMLNTRKSAPDSPLTWVNTMTSIRNHRYSTNRIIVDEWHSLTHADWPTQDLPKLVMDIPSERVTLSLPPAWQGPYTCARAHQWIRDRDNESITLLAVEKASQKAIGIVIVFEADNDGNVRLGYLLDETAWGKGFASELVGGFVEWCRDHHIISITGGVERGNVASARVLEKCGFVAEPTTGESDEQLFKMVLA